MDDKNKSFTNTNNTITEGSSKVNSTLKNNNNANTNTILPNNLPTSLSSSPIPLVPLSKKRKTLVKRKKVSQACVYCRRSHMTCDDGRPCQRCIKRNIAHLCHDEPKTNKKNKKNGGGAAANKRNTKQQQQQQQQSTVKPVNNVAKTPAIISTPTPSLPISKLGNVNATPTPSPINSAFSNFYLQQCINPFYNMNYTSYNPIFASEYVGSELNVISDFLATVNDPAFNTQLTSINGQTPSSDNALTKDNTIAALGGVASLNDNKSLADANVTSLSNDSETSNINISNDNAVSESRTEQFILKAADPPHKTSEERLAAFLNAKFEAGLLKPFNHVNGYTRLQKYMEKNMTKSSRQRIATVIELFRPSFRVVAQSLTDIDLILVEEAFERLLLEYDRVFTSMGIPSCLWRRTGEIFKSNKEFADLINMSLEDFRDGKICIYELLAEESAVNYWEKYGNIAFDPGQKAVLTSCVLRNPKKPSQGVSCCFSFTIRRDKYNIPMMIVGNFLPA